MLLQLETRALEPDVTVVELSGKITMGEPSQSVENLVKDLVRQNKKKVIFDMAGGVYVDSTGVGTIAYSFAMMARAGGALRVAACTDRVKNLMKITRLDSVLAFYPSVAAAAEGFVVTQKPGEQSPW